MAFQFVQNRTVNWLHWAAVDATDALSRESALSAAYKVKIYGFLESTSLVHFVSSGTGSMAGGDIKHVGASLYGTYALPLAKADLSDASAAWYDCYVVNLSATGAAIDTFIIEGVRTDTSAISNFFSHLSAISSDIYSALTIAQSRLLLTQSMASDAASAAVVGASRILLVQSQLSDFDSRVASDFSDVRSAIAAITATVGASDISDIASAVWAFTTRKLTSNVDLNPSTMSDLRSAIAAGPAATITASDISDITSAVWAHTIGARVDSRVLLIQSRISDAQSFLSDLSSDLRSFIGAGVALDASTMSDLRSAITAGVGAVTVSNISDIASAVQLTLASNLSDILSAAVQANSRVLLVQSRLSDFDSRVVSDFSDVRSAIAALTTAGVALDASTMSDIRSAITAGVGAVTVSNISDITSAVWAHPLGVRIDSAILLLQSQVSDVDSALTSRFSDLLSLVTTTGVQLNASTLSDLRSAITAGVGAVTVSNISDITSAVQVALASNLSDILSAAQQTNSRVLLTQSRVSDIASFLVVMSGMVSDIYSLASDLNSDLRSLITTTGVQLNASTLSDIRSAITGVTVTVSASDISDIASAVRATLASDLSDIYSAAQQTNSRALVIQSQASDIYSLLGDVNTLAGGASDILSDLYSLMSGFQSDFESRFPATIPELAADPGTTPTWAAAEALQFMWLRNNSKSTSAKRFLRNNAGTTVLSATMADDGTSFVQGKLG